MGSSSEITFQYNSKKQLISQQSSSQTTTYTYDENLIISSQLIKDSGTIYRTDYQYNSNKELVKSANYVDDQFINESNYKFENGNLILEDSEITFDDKINARYAMGRTEAFLNIDTYYNKNNPLTTSTTKWTYKYNDDGYTVEETWYRGEDPAFFIIYIYDTLTF